MHDILRASCLASIALAGVSAGAMAQVATKAPDHAGMRMPGQTDITALLTGPLGTGAANGTAAVEGTAVRVMWRGDRPGSARPWHVHRGSCARDGGKIGVASGYAPIAVDAAGNGTAMTTLDTPLDDGGEYFVAVHTSPADTTSGFIACGALWDGTMKPEQRGTAPADSMDHATMDHAAMDHSAMDSATTGRSTMPMSGATMPGIADSSLRSIIGRMLEDPVIRERAMTDPVLQGMMAQFPALKMMPAEDSSAMSHDGMTMPAETTRAKGAKGPEKRIAAPTAKPRSKPAAQRVPKPTPAAKKDSMPGMDHSKMPMKKKP